MIKVKKAGKLDCYHTSCQSRDVKEGRFLLIIGEERWHLSRKEVVDLGKKLKLVLGK